MKILHSLAVIGAVVIGLSVAQTKAENESYEYDVLERGIPEPSNGPFKDKDEEIKHLRSIVGKMRDEIINRNDEIYMLRASERHATKAADQCTEGQYSEQFRFNTK